MCLFSVVTVGLLCLLFDMFTVFAAILLISVAWYLAWFCVWFDVIWVWLVTVLDVFVDVLIKLFVGYMIVICFWRWLLLELFCVDYVWVLFGVVMFLGCIVWFSLRWFERFVYCYYVVCVLVGFSFMVVGFGYIIVLFDWISCWC